MLQLDEILRCQLYWPVNHLTARGVCSDRRGPAVNGGRLRAFFCTFARPKSLYELRSREARADSRANVRAPESCESALEIQLMSVYKLPIELQSSMHDTRHTLGDRVSPSVIHYSAPLNI